MIVKVAFTRVFIATVLLLFPLNVSVDGASKTNKSKPMNVLFIVCDDLNNHLGCYGYKQVRSPNIDRLASESMRFDNFYCQYPVCNPSRSSFLTGLRPDTTGIFSQSGPMRENLPEVVALPQCFKDQGYWTAVVNKFFHDRQNDGDRSWDVRKHFDDARNPVIVKARQEFEDKHGSINEAKNREAWSKKKHSVRDLAHGQTPPGYGPTNMADEEQGDGKAVKQIIRWLENKAYGDKPFFIGWGIQKPHIPHFVPQKYFDLYPLDSFRFPPQPTDDLKDVPQIAITNRYKLYGDPVVTDATLRKVTAAYYACITFIDTQVGLLLDTVKRLGLEENTIIVFTSDNGYLLGEHGLLEKAMLFEESARIPLIMWVPGKTRPGSACKRLVEFVDIYPTLADLCGVKPPENLEGISFVPLLTMPDRPWKLGAFTMTTRSRRVLIGRSVRSEQWRYMEWGDPEVNELYDHVNDPHEYKNLAKIPKYAEQVRRMRELLHGGWKKALPPK
ncbi:MAG: sulfatase [Planctomycetota bacterium]|nr:MAG: sulfatase [Planctomycetota bacterium]